VELQLPRFPAEGTVFSRNSSDYSDENEKKTEAEAKLSSKRKRM